MSTRVDRLRLAHVLSHVAVRLRAVDTDEHAMRKRHPGRFERSAIEARRVPREVSELVQLRLRDRVGLDLAHVLDVSGLRREEVAEQHVCWQGCIECGVEADELGTAAESQRRKRLGDVGRGWRAATDERRAAIAPDFIRKQPCEYRRPERNVCRRAADLLASLRAGQSVDHVAEGEEGLIDLLRFGKALPRDARAANVLRARQIDQHELCVHVRLGRPPFLITGGATLSAFGALHKKGAERVRSRRVLIQFRPGEHKLRGRPLHQSKRLLS